VLSQRLRDLLAQTHAGVDILDHSQDVETDVVEHVRKLRQKAHDHRQEGEGLINDAMGLERNADAIEAALLAAAGGLT